MADRTEMHELLERLDNAFNELSTGIHTAESKLRGREDTSQEVLDNLEYYKEIASKQKKLVSELKLSIYEQDFDKVSILVKKINSFSSLIKEDALYLISKSKNLKPASDDTIKH